MAQFVENKFEKGQILRKIWICLNNSICDQTSKLGEILTKTCFSTQSEPHTVKICFSVVLKLFLEIHRELLFLVKKMAISERSTEYSQSLFFSTCLKRGKY